MNKNNSETPKVRFVMRQLPCDAIVEPAEPVKTRHKKRGGAISPTLANSEVYYGVQNWSHNRPNSATYQNFEVGDMVFAVDKLSGRDMVCIIETIGERDFNGQKYPQYRVRTNMDGRLLTVNSVRRVNTRT